MLPSLLYSRHHRSTDLATLPLPSHAECKLLLSGHIARTKSDPSFQVFRGVSFQHHLRAASGVELFLNEFNSFPRGFQYFPLEFHSLPHAFHLLPYGFRLCPQDFDPFPHGFCYFRICFVGLRIDFIDLHMFSYVFRSSP